MSDDNFFTAFGAIVLILALILFIFCGGWVTSTQVYERKLDSAGCQLVTTSYYGKSNTYSITCTQPIKDLTDD